MTVIDGRTQRGKERESFLPFEGFLEALCRVAPMKAFPTDAEIGAVGQPDAGSYLAWLKETDEEAYEGLVASRATPWGDAPPQPHDRCVAHLLSLIIRTMEEDSRGTDDLVLTEAEVNDWVKKTLKGGGGK